MKTALQTTLARLAPSVSIVTLWDHDPDAGPISSDCDGFTPAEDYDWQAWNSEVRATAIIGGEEITGSAYLGGTWEKAGDDPATSNPEISGYEPQMTVEALEELHSAIPDCEDDAVSTSRLSDEITAALAYLKQFMRDAYEAQRAEIAARAATV